MSIAIPGDVEVTETSWRPMADLSREQWEQEGTRLLRMGRAVNFWLGDWVLYGEQHYGETYTEAIDLTGYEYQTVANIIWVARSVPELSRRRELSWSHHEAVASLEAPEQESWLALAEEEGMTVARLRSRLQGAKKSDSEPAVLPVMTHVGRLSFKLAAGSDEQAREQLEALKVLVERKGVVVTSSKVQAL